MISSALSFTLLGAVLISSVLGSVIDPHFRHSDSRARHTRAHSLGADYVFDPRDGWTSLNATGMAHKRPRLQREHVETSDAPGHVPGSSRPPMQGHIPSKHAARKTKRTVTHGVLFGDDLFGESASDSASASGGSSTSESSPATDSTANHVAGSTSDTLSDVFKAVGSAETVVITWYTGHDLENPSCWSDNVWTPTDASFVAALTLEGWHNKPACFDFLEVCSGPERCTHVRVVDTCAGCAPSSHHVDLTQAAFLTLADLNVGVLNVQMRPVSSPSGAWHQDLWGPKAHAH